AAPRNATTVLAAPTGATAASVNACWRGIAAVRGVALGVAVHWRTEDPEIAAIGQGLEAERAALAGALSAVRERIERKAAGAKAHRGIFEAHRALLEDPELTDRAEDALRQGASAGSAWRAAIEAATATLRASGETRIAERAADLRDLRTQVLRALAGLPAEVAVELPLQAVLIAEELLPSQWLELDHDRLAGVAMAAGGATSHVAILAAARGIPLLVALGPAVLTIAPGSEVILDAETGELIAHPDPRRLRDTTATLAARETERAADLAAAHAPCVSADGVPVTVNANLGSLEDARLALTNGADGCGLLRTEFLFLDRAEAPDEDEQTKVYQRIAAALDGRPLTIRTLDAGGDKPIAYLPLPPEENPALGLRGIRTSLYQPALLATQLRAILRVRPAGVCRILLPMVSGLGEVRNVRAALEEARASVGAGTTTPIGVMVETPAAALLAGQLAAETDFFSIGTNDLSQYVLAMDRGHATLAAALDALHPAVLRLIAATAEAGRRAGRPVAVCGALASDVLAVPVLLGLGVHELSAVPALVPRLKRLIRGLELAACARLAERALDCIDGAAVRRLVADWSRRGGHDDVE
ncbi:MAG: phosphoenolpyruvate--protein phosphotransferase, partial [Gammaproteobacteria bacterium]|nr:phosphoenolpyruvate--protein phosphotransferase [Gammaproteobacteria bacterium]